MGRDKALLGAAGLAVFIGLGVVLIVPGERPVPHSPAGEVIVESVVREQRLVLRRRASESRSGPPGLAPEGAKDRTCTPDGRCTWTVDTFETLRHVARRDDGHGALEWPTGLELGAPQCLPCARLADLPGESTCCDRERSYRVTFRDLGAPGRTLPALEPATANELSGFFAGQKVELRVEGERVEVTAREPVPPHPPAKCWHCP